MLTVHLCGIFQTDAKFSHRTTGNQGSMLAWCQDQATKLCAEAGHVNGFSTVLMQSYGCKLAQSGQTKLVPFRNTTCTCTHRWSAHIPHFITLFFLHHSYFPLLAKAGLTPIDTSKNSKVVLWQTGDDTQCKEKKHKTQVLFFTMILTWKSLISQFPTHSLR